MIETAQFKKKLTQLECDTRTLQRLRKITNELLTNCAYSIKNMEKQNEQFDKANVPAWERKIINDAYDVKRKLAKKLFIDLKELLDGVKVDN